jgi:hypothetical protein
MSTARPGRDRSDAFVFFGATGDLAFKRIVPALARLISDEGWDPPIIGVARHGRGGEQSRAPAVMPLFGSVGSRGAGSHTVNGPTMLIRPSRTTYQRLR